MNRTNAQELFLLEFLVDKVNIPSVQAMHEELLNVKTCIEFKILNLPPIYICQDTPLDTCTCLGDDAQVFRKGKSCLFALPCKLLQKPLCSFPITLSVYKKLPPTVLPDVMTIGTCQIETSDMMNSMLSESLASNPCKTLKSNFRISTATGQCVGEVGVFIRFSRLGTKVVTQFQNPHSRKPFLFKGSDDSPVFQCRKVPSQLDGDDAFKTCVCEKDEKLACRSQERAPKSCCKDGRSSKSAKRKGKGRRPCCPGSGKESRAASASSPAKNVGYSCGSESQAAKETRQCGCDIKENKSSSCKR